MCEGVGALRVDSEYMGPWILKGLCSMLKICAFVRLKLQRISVENARATPAAAVWRTVWGQTQAREVDGEPECQSCWVAEGLSCVWLRKRTRLRTCTTGWPC